MNHDSPLRMKKNEAANHAEDVNRVKEFPLGTTPIKRLNKRLWKAEKSGYSPT